MSYSPQDIARFAEIHALKERQAQIEAEIDRRNRSDSTQASQALMERHHGQQDQAWWQEAFDVHGRVAPPQREGESNGNYNRRLASMMQIYSPEWKNADLHDAPQSMLS
jgi:hypothetical protein